MKTLLLISIVLLCSEGFANDSLTLKKNAISLEIGAPTILTLNYNRILSQKKIKNSLRFGTTLRRQGQLSIVGYSFEFGQKRNRFESEIVGLFNYRPGRTFIVNGENYPRLSIYSFPQLSYKRYSLNRRYFFKASFSPFYAKFTGSSPRKPFVALTPPIFMAGLSTGIQF